MRHAFFLNLPVVPADFELPDAVVRAVPDHLGHKELQPILCRPQQHMFACAETSDAIQAMVITTYSNPSLCSHGFNLSRVQTVELARCDGHLSAAALPALNDRPAYLAAPRRYRSRHLWISGFQKPDLPRSNCWYSEPELERLCTRELGPPGQPGPSRHRGGPRQRHSSYAQKV